MGRGSSTSLAPGFRFHPTDEELVRYYLKRKVSGKPLRFDPISEVDVYKSEPWDLPDKSRLKSRDLEWYFFSVLDKKYGNGSKTNRATENGYWKTTGKDRPIRHYSRTVGMKKTLVYHSGRAPRGQRSNWVMHEYRLTDEELEKAGIAQDAFVLCRIFQKSGPGPKNGEQYGAPFVEEEWEDEGMALFPDQQVIAEEVVVEDMNGESNEFDQDVPVGIPIGVAPLSENYGYGSSSNDNEQPGNLDENDQNAPEEDGESQLEAQHPDENKFFVLPQEYDMDVKPVKREYAGPSADDMNLGGGNYLDGTFMDATDNPPFGDELYLNDLSYPVETDPDGFNVEDYLTFFDSDNDDMVANDSSLLVRNDDSASAEHIQQEKEACGENENIPDTYQHPAPFHGHDEASSSRQDKEPEQLKPDFKHAFLKQASHMLGSYPAPPAYASEYPIKDAALRINSAAHASSSVHVTAGMMRIRNLTLSVSGMEWSLGKNGELNVIVSVGLSHDGVRPASTYDSGYKTPSVVSWSWALFLVLWIILLSVSVKLGVSICSR